MRLGDGRQCRVGTAGLWMGWAVSNENGEGASETRPRWERGKAGHSRLACSTEKEPNPSHVSSEQELLVHLLSRTRATHRVEGDVASSGRRDGVRLRARAGRGRPVLVRERETRRDSGIDGKGVTWKKGSGNVCGGRELDLYSRTLDQNLERASEESEVFSQYGERAGGGRPIQTDLLGGVRW